MNQDLLFSFVIPVYNVSLFIEPCVDSVLKQDSDQFEIILVDDGSKDDSGIICDRLASEHPCIKVIHKENGGLSSARNAGVQAASGEYVFFLDADDTIKSDFLLHILQMDHFQQYDLIIGKVEMISDLKQCKEKVRSVIYRECSGKEALEQYTREQIPGYAVCKLIRRSLILDNKIEFPVGHNYEDIRTIYKYLVYAERVAILEHTYYNYFISNQSSITNNDSMKNLKDYYDSIETMYNDLQKREKLPFLLCLRLNHLIQLHIRLFYFSKRNTEAISLLKKVDSILNTEKVAISSMRGYCHYRKYMLYRLKLLNALLRIKGKINR